MKSPREVAFEVLQGVEFDDSYANLLLNKLLKDQKLDSRDSALAQELAFGAIRWRYFYESLVERCAGRKINEVDRKVLLFLLMGSHQLLAMRVPAHAAISETVELSKKFVNQGGVGFINGVLRRVSEKSFEEWMQTTVDTNSSDIAQLSIRYSHPEWIVRAFRQSLELDGRGNELEDLLVQDNTAAKVNVVALPGFCEPKELEQLGYRKSKSSPIGFELDSGNPANLRLVREGKVRVQDAGSQLVALALVEAQPVKEDEQWLDLCAGPGGKAALLAALAIKHKALLTCNEIAPHRAKLVEQALAPINPEVYVRTGDGRDLGQDAPESFDRILIDAPCTGLGSLRRKPEARWRKSSESIAELVKLQKELIESAWKGLKPGGLLVYATCSPHVSETVAVVDWCLKHLGSVDLIDGQNVMTKISSSYQITGSRKTVQLWPQVHHTDAMFLAILRKTIG